MSDYESIEFDAMIARQEENYVKHVVRVTKTLTQEIEIYDYPDADTQELEEAAIEQFDETKATDDMDAEYLF